MFAWILTAALAVAPAPVASIDPPLVPSREEILAVPPALRAELQEHVISPGGGEERRLSRLAGFLFDPEGLGMSYQPDADHTVSEAWQTRRANCLTFTLLTIALAREAGLDAYGQEITRTLSWYSEGDTLYFSNHVNAGIRIRQHRFSVDVASDNVLTGEPPRAVDDDRLVSIFYSNRAAALLAQGKHEAAAAFAAAALEADAGYATAWNNTGVVRLRTGRADQAEQDFLRALELDHAHDGALMNLATLYGERGDKHREAEFRKRIEKSRRRNPFHYFMLAMDDEKRGDYARAARHYRRAIGLYAGEHRFHHGLARAYLHQGRFRKAGEALRNAQAVAGHSARERYQAKLDLLRRKGLNASGP